MKTEFLILAIIAAALAADVADQSNVTPEQMAKLKQIENDCLQENNVEASVVQKFNEGEFSDSPGLRCYYQCYNMKSGSMHIDGTFHLENMQSILPSAHVPIAKKCINEINGIDGICNRAYQFYKCYIKHLFGKE